LALDPAVAESAQNRAVWAWRCDLPPDRQIALFRH